jgi:hypothetical protein
MLKSFLSFDNRARSCSLIIVSYHLFCRDKAENLLLRQQMLEDIAEQNQLVAREGGRLILSIPQ